MDMITTSEAANLAGVTPQYINTLIKAGKFPGARKISDHPNAPYLIPLSQFKIWHKKRAQAAKT